MNSGYVGVVPEDWTIFNYQRCSCFPLKILESLQALAADSPGASSLDSFLSLTVSEKNYRLLVKVSAVQTVNNENKIKCDMRVREVVLNVDWVKMEYHRIMLEVTDILIAQLIYDMKPDFWSWCSSARVKLQPFTVDSAVETETAAARLLRPGVIKTLKLTVIIQCSAVMEDEQKCINSRSYIYSEVLRDCFKSYNLHVKTNTLVDLRDCPLVTGLSPKVSFVYVQNCTMKKPETEIGKVNSQTNIIIQSFNDIEYYSRVMNHLTYFSSANPDLLHGLELPFSILEESVGRKERTHGCATSHGFLLAGPSGSGKTLVVREVCTRYLANLFELDFSQHETTLKNDPDKLTQLCSNVFSKGIHSSYYMGYPTLILLESIDILHTADESNRTSESRLSKSKHRIINHLCELFDMIEGRKVLRITIVGTTTKPYLVPPKIRRFGRLQQDIFIKVPDEVQRIGILNSLKQRFPELQTMDSEKIGRKTPGYVGADLMRLIHLAMLKAHEGKETEVSEVHIKYALSRVYPSVLHGSVGVVDIPRALSLDDISGLQSVKLNLIKTIVWPLQFPQAFFRMGITPSKGILLYGPPGCGKTTLVRAVASSHHTNFLSVSAAELFSSGVGDSEKIVSHLFHRARMASPCILFIDELESIVGSRDVSTGGKGKGVNETILSMLLTEMDGIGVRAQTVPSAHEINEDVTNGPRVVVVGATNRPDLIDAALLRPGRFDRIVPVPPPNKEDRLEMLKKSTTNTPLSGDVDFVKLAGQTERYSGADLMNLCREAALFALTENMNAGSVRMEHYERARAQSHPSISLEYLETFQEYASGNGCSSSSTLTLTNRLKALRL